MDVRKLFGLVILIVFFTALIPTIVSQVQDPANTGRLYDGNLSAGEHGWNFTGHAGAITIFLLIPFIVVAAFAMSIVLNLIGKGGV